MKNLYCLWIVPPTGEKELLQKVIINLSKKYHSSSFEPHVTLLSDISCYKEVMIQKANILASKLHIFPLCLNEISFSTTYFQSAFIRVKATAALMNANLIAKEIYQVDNNVFMPHLSLIYGNHTMDKREKIVSEVILPKNIKFNVEKIIVTPCTNNPNDWIHLAELPLKTIL
jgi:2'-5' RNA ligase